MKQKLSTDITTNIQNYLNGEVSSKILYRQITKSEENLYGYMNNPLMEENYIQVTIKMAEDFYKNVNCAKYIQEIFYLLNLYFKDKPKMFEEVTNDNWVDPNDETTVDRLLECSCINAEDKVKLLDSNIIIKNN